MPRPEPVFLTGATGYVGGRLAPLLLEAGYRVRIAGRSLPKLMCRPWARHPRAELVQADMLDADGLKRALTGCRAAYYLVHSMTAKGPRFAENDRRAALNMRAAAEEAGLERIIYLGGLGERESDLSPHLRSRLEVADIFQAGRVPLTFLRAAVILGAGSASFEIMRYLVERLPVMLTPRWVCTLCQPIAIRNVLRYLQGCLEEPRTTGDTFEIGGPDVLTYQALMQLYAEEARLPKRRVIPVPFLTPRLSSWWIHLITPVPAAIARPLSEGLRNPVVCRDNRIRDLIPQDLLSCREAIRLALERVRQEVVDTCWSDAGPHFVPEWVTCGDAPYAGGTVLECSFRTALEAAPQDVWQPVQAIGGRRGWYFGDWLWVLRGWIDRLMGGIGLRRGRRDDTRLYVGDALDFWRVLDVEPPHRLVLLAEMKLPGEALLEFRVTPLPDGTTELAQISRFLPRGLGGLVYWRALFPLHRWLFRGMLRAIARSVGRPLRQAPEAFEARNLPVCQIGPRPATPQP